jgi:serine/threonine protein kinase/Tol biopolymer transport system component
MRFNAGTKLGRYEIRSKLGAGGMGEVYQGRDTQLGRDVAVKVLPTTVSTDPDRLRRFEQEACAASALNHPNILIVHDIGAHDDTTYVVSELLEGETLRNRISGTPLAQRRAIDYALQIANGLAAAHAKGIIHRDLKPDNVFVTNDGRVKILDFGLAKLTQLDGDQAAQTDIPTRRVDTDPGLVMGTVGYMSPEQLKGRPADQRSDIFSFGAILYEMLSGRRAFHGESTAETMSAILREDPPELSETNHNVSPALERLVNHCLDKNPEERFHSSRDLAFALESLSGSVPISTHPAPIPALASREMKRRELIAWILAALALLTTVVLFIADLRRPVAELHAVRSFILPPEKSSFDFSARLGSTIALSPDGRRLAFVAAVEGKQLLWIRSLDVLSVQSLAGTEGAMFPFWSKDSRYVGFFAEQKLKKIDVAGGPPITLCDAPDGRGGTWNQDGIIVFAPTSSGVLHRVAASGGTSTAITKLDETGVETSHRWPFFLSDSEHFLYLGGGGLTIGEGAVITVGSLRNNDRKVLVSADSNAAYAQGYLLFLRERTLMAQAFDPKRLEMTGDPFPIAEQVQTGRIPGTAIFSVSDEGVLAYQSGPGESGSQLTWFDRTNKPIRNLGDVGSYNSFALSPDAKSVTVSVSNQAGISNVWLYEVARGVKTPFTFGPAQTRAQVWSPDGGSIVFTSNRKGHFDLYRKAFSGAGSEQLLMESNLNKIPTSFSADGRFLLYNVTDPKTKVDVWVLPLDGSQKPFPFLQGDFNENNAQFSPDGRWVAYQSNESNRYEIYATPFPGASGKRQISISGGRLPKWRGNELFYLSPDDKLMVSVVTVHGDTLEVGAAQPLFEIRPGGPGNTYDVTPDGQRFLVNTAVEQQITLPITLVLNWTADLKK